MESLEQRVFLTVLTPGSLLVSPDSSPGTSASLLLTWTDNSNNETSFKVERGTDGVTFTQIGTAGANAVAYDDTTVAGGTHYYYRIRASNASEDSAYSNVSDAVEWASSNIGTNTGGSFSVNNGTVTMVTAGAGTGASTDDLRMAYRTLSGDGYVIAKVTAVQYTNPLAKAGVMFREGLGANARNVFMAITPSGNAQWEYRANPGNNTTFGGSTSGAAAPYWVKIVREGSRFTGYLSSNGSSWIQVGQINIAMAANAYVGLALTSSGYGAYNTSTFTNVSVTRTDHSLPSGWGDQDVGSVSFVGSARFYHDTFTFAVESSGQDVGGYNDAFHFAHRTLSGDGEIIARVSAVQTGYDLAKAGIMFRDGTDDNARNVFLAITAGGNAEWQYRPMSGGDSNSAGSQSGASAPYWLRIVRSGNTFTGYISSDGTSWSQIGSDVNITDGMSDSLEVGLALSAAGYGNLNTSTFDNIKIIPAVPTLTATLVHAHRVDLAWTGNPVNQPGYVLQRSEDGGSTWTTLSDGGEIHASGFVDDTVDPAITYQYRIKSFIDDVVRGESDWSAPVTAATAGLGNGLSATYYDTIDFSGTSVTRVDPNLDFRWNEGQSPAGGIASNTFTAEWRGQILAPASGTYTFSTLADDGVRLWVNDELILNDWDVQSPSTARGTIDLDADNKYDIRVEYFQNYGSGDMHLNWVVPGTGTDAVTIPTADLYSDGGQFPAAPDTPTEVRGDAPVASDVLTSPRVSVSWAEVTGADVYLIYRSDDDGATWAVAGSVLAGNTTFTDRATTLDPARHYPYRVMAVGAGGRSALADVLDQTTNVDTTRSGDGVIVSLGRPG